MTDRIFIEHDLKAALEDGYQAGFEAAQPKWISVKDRLPEPGMGKLLVFVQHEHGNIVDMARYLGSVGWDLVSWKLWDNCVTHWMPLPEPPKEE